MFPVDAGNDNQNDNLYAVRNDDDDDDDLIGC